MRTTLLLGLAGLLFLVSPALGADLLIVSNRGDNTVQFFDTASGQSVAVLDAGVGAHEFAVSPNGKTVVGACYGSGPMHKTPDQRLLVFSLEGEWQPTLIELEDNPRPNDLRFVDEERVWVTSEIKQRILEVDLPGKRILRSLPYGEHGGHMLAWSKARQEAYVPCVPSGKVMVLNTQAPKPASAEEGSGAPQAPIVATLQVGKGAEGIDLSPDGRWLWVASHMAQKIAVIDTESRETVETIPSDGHPFRIRFTPDGSHAVIAHPGAHEVRWYDSKTRQVAGRVAMPGGFPTCVAVGTQNRYAYAVCGPQKRIAQIDLKEGQIKTWFATGVEPDAVAISAYGKAPSASGPVEDSPQTDSPPKESD